jgi:hypothetical protein
MKIMKQTLPCITRYWLDTSDPRRLDMGVMAYFKGVGGAVLGLGITVGEKAPYVGRGGA